jgi:hypothetical protein
VGWACGSDNTNIIKLPICCFWRFNKLGHHRWTHIHMHARFVVFVYTLQTSNMIVMIVFGRSQLLNMPNIVFNMWETLSTTNPGHTR